MMTSSSSVMTAPNGDRRIIQTDFYHCELCRSFVRREDRNRGALLATDENFTPLPPRVASLDQSLCLGYYLPK